MKITSTSTGGVGRCIHRIDPSPGDALLVVDLQNDFLPSGALPVEDADRILPVVNRYLEMFDKRQLPVVASRDWHPSRHCSFTDFGGTWPLRVTAPLHEAQLVESRLINLLHFQTTIASKAVRSPLAGFDGTATVLAGMQFDIPVFGTMAHSFIEAHDHEMEAFEHFASANPDNVTLLIDTYDTEPAARQTVELARTLKLRGIKVRGVRLDSGDLAEHARRVRRILDEGGLQDTTIFASGNLDEYRLREFAGRQIPIDGYGVGTRVDVSADAPYLNYAYKLQEYAGQPRQKLSEGKATWPGRKQVFRRFQDGRMAADTVALEAESVPGSPLLHPMMKAGQRLEPRLAVSELRRNVQENLSGLPAALRSLDRVEPYAVEISPAIQRLAESLRSAMRRPSGLPDSRQPPA
jgi:nicotinate phosphoribosyltransferase